MALSTACYKQVASLHIASLCVLGYNLLSLWQSSIQPQSYPLPSEISFKFYHNCIHEHGYMQKGQITKLSRSLSNQNRLNSIKPDILLCQMPCLLNSLNQDTSLIMTLSSVRLHCIYMYDPTNLHMLLFQSHSKVYINDSGQRERERAERLTSTGIKLRISVWKSSALTTKPRL